MLFEVVLTQFHLHLQAILLLCWHMAQTGVHLALPQQCTCLITARNWKAVSSLADEAFKVDMV